MNNEITKEEIVGILKDTIYHLSIDRSKSSWDDRDYERLGDEDYNDIAEDMAGYINDLLLSRRTEKIMKIKKIIKQK